MRVSDFVKPFCKLPHDSSLDFADNSGKNLETVLAVEVTIRPLRDSNDAIVKLTNYLLKKMLQCVTCKEKLLLLKINKSSLIPELHSCKTKKAATIQIHSMIE